MEVIKMKRSKGQRVGHEASFVDDEKTVLERTSTALCTTTKRCPRCNALDGSQQMGMPHRRFHGRTGFIQKQGVAWVVSVKDGNMQEAIARPEHLRLLSDHHD